eukprot:NODE_11278_length_310_cov_12.467433_g10365_i0.p2 GENE.NODE_11278_length_310_cov_12.467433_g10365_i0~~NODE_11278_length_310_cov_12.467433_g10365_i0.p2  ORF type:complete len:66 (-),score=16.37 NODE_11278_length_310_cov_12.467433_g10365_i0:112-285(-)
MGNQVTEWSEVEKLRCLPHLHSVYFRHNPFFHDARYRPKLASILPALTDIDSLPLAR